MDDASEQQAKRDNKGNSQRVSDKNTEQKLKYKTCWSRADKSESKTKARMRRYSEGGQERRTAAEKLESVGRAHSREGKEGQQELREDA